MKNELNEERHDLFSQLKEATAEVHKNVMKQPWASRVLNLNYDKKEYVTLLEKYYGFYFPVETLVLRERLEFQRVKHSLLEEDLAAVSPHSNSLKNICSILPWAHDLPSALGVCYVLEGATLGGQLIAACLTKSLGLQEKNGLRFFTCYGSETQRMWEQFKSQTRILVQSPSDQSKMIEAALRTFDCLANWMEAI